MNDERFNKRKVRKYLTITSIIIFVVGIILTLCYLDNQLSIVGDHMDSLAGLVLFFIMPVFSGIPAMVINIVSLLLILLLWFLYNFTVGVFDLINEKKELKVYIRIALSCIFSIVDIVYIVKFIMFLIMVL